jgi:hypothetical protein
MRGTQHVALSLKGLPGPTTDHDDTDMPPPRCVPAPAHATSPPRPLHELCQCYRAPCDCMHYITIPLAAACIASPCPSRCHAHCSCMHMSLCSLRRHTTCLYIFQFLIPIDLLFCSLVTMLSPSLPTDAWPSSPSRTYHGATTDH